ncbi:hypothetical protein P7K49_001260 [Saguinus oedipus]|uniref:IF rod domain-containing protein n=1 Tax=Saguinus oedipus TaxID=9490 RepID=A0ABQ9WFV3_SAGOE|nr:hypothetical protein P7K49_001260 [Saguinus oedipus]
MSFTTRSTFSTNYRSVGSVRVPSYDARLVSSMASVYAGAKGSGSCISMSHSTSFQSGMGVGALLRVRSLEPKNQKLESEIQEHLEKGPQVRDWGHYFKTIEDLRAQIFTNTVDNAHIVLQIDNAHLAPNDFRVKYETELAICQSVESDIHGLREVIDDTSITRLQRETEIEALKEELLFRKKNHEEEAKGLPAQTANSGLTVETRAEGQRQAQEYEDLLNIKVKLEAELTTYRRLLENGEDFSLSDALDSSNSMQTIQKTTTCRIVDGKVVSETNDTKLLRH